LNLALTRHFGCEVGIYRRLWPLRITPVRTTNGATPPSTSGCWTASVWRQRRYHLEPEGGPPSPSLRPTPSCVPFGTRWPR